VRSLLFLVLALLLASPARAGGLDDAVVYGVAPSAFGTRGADDVTARLDALVDLGVDVLWLAPIMKAPPGDYGYAVTDYFALRSDFGDAASLRRLIDEAHRRGLKVLLDVAVNHTSDRHPWFVDAQRRGRASPYWDYYDRDPQHAATHYFDWRNLPNLNYANERVREVIASVFTFWTSRFDVDGFRLDAAWGVRDRAPAFWPSLVASLRARAPKLIMLAEASAREPYWAKSGFDCAYDWAGPLGHAAWQEAFDHPAEIATRLRRILTNEPAGCALRFLENNDTGPRFITRHGVELTRVATTLMLTLPGAPLVFTGEEVGAEYLPYDPHGAIDWRDRHELRPLFKQLIALRHRVAALRSHRLTLVNSDDKQVLAYLRQGDDGPPALVVLDFGDATRARLELPRELHGPWRDLLSGETFASAATVALPRFGARILVRAP